MASMTAERFIHLFETVVMSNHAPATEFDKAIDEIRDAAKADGFDPDTNMLDWIKTVIRSEEPQS